MHLPGVGDATLVGFIATRGLAASRSFYEGVLGLRVIEGNASGVVCDAGGTELRLTRVGELRPAPYTVLGWEVTDISERVASLCAAGVSFTRYEGMAQDEDGVWTAPGGTLVAWFTDPDGNVLSLSQPPAM